MASLSPEQRSLLQQRAGSERAAPSSIAALSVGLGISQAAVLDRLRQASGALRTIAQTTGCAGGSIGFGTASATDPLLGSSRLFADAGSAPIADRSAVAGVSAQGGPKGQDAQGDPSSQRGTASGPRDAARSGDDDPGPGTDLLVALTLLMLALAALGAFASRRVGPYRRPRPRRAVSPQVYALAQRTGFRYSSVRDALVLRGVGERFGPVLVREGGRGRPARTPSAPAPERDAVRASRRASATTGRKGRPARRAARPRR